MEQITRARAIIIGWLQIWASFIVLFNPNFQEAGGRIAFSLKPTPHTSPLWLHLPVIEYFLAIGLKSPAKEEFLSMLIIAIKCKKKKKKKGNDSLLLFIYLFHDYFEFIQRVFFYVTVLWV